MPAPPARSAAPSQGGEASLACEASRSHNGFPIFAFRPDRPGTCAGDCPTRTPRQPFGQDEARLFVSPSIQRMAQALVRRRDAPLLWRRRLRRQALALGVCVRHLGDTAYARCVEQSNWLGFSRIGHVIKVDQTPLEGKPEEGRSAEEGRSGLREHPGPPHVSRSFLARWVHSGKPPPPRGKVIPPGVGRERPEADVAVYPGTTPSSQAVVPTAEDWRRTPGQKDSQPSQAERRTDMSQNATPLSDRLNNPEECYQGPT